MRLTCVLTLLGAWLALPGLAQTDFEPEATDQPRVRQGPRRAGPGGRGMRLGALIRRLPEQLELDDEQRAQFEDLVAEYRERMGGPDERGAGLRELFREMRAAREAGDEQRVAELRAKLREQGPQRPVRMIEQFFDDVEGILRQDQAEKLGELRGRVLRRMRGGADMRARLGELRERLDLDQQQNEQFDELLASLREQGAQRRQALEELRPLVRELREAVRAGDEQRAAELRAELEQRRPARGRGWEVFFTELEKILRDDQRAVLAEFRAEAEQAGRRGRQDLRTILAAARRLKLNADQKDELKKISREAMRAERALDRRDRAARSELAAKVKKEIIAILDADQAERFEQALSRRSRPERSDRAGDRRPQRERRRARAADGEQR